MTNRKTRASPHTKASQTTCDKQHNKNAKPPQPHKELCQEPHPTSTKQKRKQHTTKTSSMGKRDKATATDQPKSSNATSAHELNRFWAILLYRAKIG
jgi:hypothetical protein